MKVRNLLFSPALLTITLLIAACGGGGPTTPDTFTLDVNKTGVGTVTSTPAGIDCGEDCNEDFSSGTEVTLTATAEGESTFAGWSGACSGTGTCTVTITGDKTVNATFTGGGGGTTDMAEVQITNDVDDAEEYVNTNPENSLVVAGAVSLTSSDLELNYDRGFKTGQVVGLRFTDLTIPEGATITDARIEFTPASNVGASVPALTVKAETSATPAAFEATSNNITSRPLTDASVAWSPAVWTAGVINEASTTPNLAPLLSEIGWTSGNPIVFVFQPDGTDSQRQAESAKGSTPDGPKLVVTYTTP